MGKFEDSCDKIDEEKMSQTKLSNGYYDINSKNMEDSKKLWNIPEGLEILNNQVAGHDWSTKKQTLGLLKQGERVFKPIPHSKLSCGTREINFYENVHNSKENFCQLKDLVPKYYGTTTLSINDKLVKCIILEDVTCDFAEPCIMDIKIGKQTWDPEAKFEKILAEQEKYKECKRDLGFCIPGFQVFKISDNNLIKFDKCYGKSLNKDTVSEALKIFLNGENGFCRSLLMQILAPLWKIQHWARNQTSLRLYSSSLLLIYDARRLKDCLKYQNLQPTLKLSRSSSLYRPISMAVLNVNEEKSNTGFSGQLTKEGPILTSSIKKRFNLEIPFKKKCNNVWQQSFRNLKRTHSFQNNYEENFRSQKNNYRCALEDLCCEPKSELWGTVKMIDFARTYPSNKCDIDDNYLQGIESLVKIIEEFLFFSE